MSGEADGRRPLPPLADHLANPRNVGRVSTGRRAGAVIVNEPTGDAVSFSVRIEGDRIVEARQSTFGARPLGAIASYLSECVCGQETDHAAAIRPEDIIRAMQVPGPFQYCAYLVVRAMHGAFERYRQRYGVERGDAK
jgi:NifU-like protein involved in Fe-S cluster formation